MKKETEMTEQEFLKNYNPGDYARPSNTVDILLFTVIEKKLKLLLIKRRNHPWQGQWALPGGFCNINESLDEAVLRELSEETNVSDANYFHQLYTLGAVKRDPRMRVITTAYLSLTPAENLKNVKAGDDARDAKWFDVSKSKPVEISKNTFKSVLTLSSDDILIEYEIIDEVNKNYIKRDSKLLEESTDVLAADHIKLVNMGMDKLRHRVASSGLMFNLLPEEFTLKQAQEVYEALLGSKKDTANFRRDILKLLTLTDKNIWVYNKETKLYRFNPLYNYMVEEI